VRHPRRIQGWRQLVAIPCPGAPASWHGSRDAIACQLAGAVPGAPIARFMAGDQVQEEQQAHRRRQAVAAPETISLQTRAGRNFFPYWPPTGNIVTHQWRRLSSVRGRRSVWQAPGRIGRGGDSLSPPNDFSCDWLFKLIGSMVVASGDGPEPPLGHQTMVGHATPAGRSCLGTTSPRPLNPTHAAPFRWARNMTCKSVEKEENHEQTHARRGKQI